MLTLQGATVSLIRLLANQVEGASDLSKLSLIEKDKKSGWSREGKQFYRPGWEVDMRRMPKNSLKSKSPGIPRLTAQCVYESVDDPCEFCVQRNRKCKKVWGPLRSIESQNDSDIGPEVRALSKYPVSLISDSNLSAQDLYYLRYLFDVNSRCTFSALGTIFRYLWESYGFNLSNSSGCLLPSAMASAAIDNACRVGGAIPTEYYEYISRFHEDLLGSIRANKVDETHLFALSLAIHTARLYSFINRKESAAYYTYLNLFCVTLEQMIRQHAEPHGYPPKAIWNYTLLFLRRNYLYPQGVAAITQDSDTHLYRMHHLSTELPAAYNFDGMLNEVTDPGLYFMEEGSKFFFQCFWNVTDILCSLQSNFRNLYRVRLNQSSNLDMDRNYARLLEAVRLRTESFERLRYMDKVFEVGFNGR